jgi:formate dehydrogenase alpha subunit
VAGLATSFGSGAMTNSIECVEKAGALLVIGSNTTENHPIIGDRVKRAVVLRGAKLIVIDPRKIELTKYANVSIQIQPGFNIPVLNAMMHTILAEGLHDQPYIDELCEGFDEFKDSLAEFSPEKVELLTGVPAESLREAARLYATSKPASILYCMGVTQHSQGTDAVKALANLAMLCGQVGVEGGGVNPLRGQNNVQGACDMGGLPNVYPGYQRVNDEAAAAKFEEAWGKKLSRQVGLTLTEITDAAAEGRIKGLYIMGENPMITDPDLHHIEQALSNLEFLVVQDIFLTETAAKADVVLPAVSFAEKDGTFSNTERRVQRVRAAVAPKGEARADWQILQELATRMGYRMQYGSPSEIFDELASVTPSYAGIDYARLEGGGIPWPCPTKDHPGTPILHLGGFVRGKGLFQPIEFRGADEQPDEQYPFYLTTGREHAHYHSGSMTRNCARINDCFPEGFMEVHPADAEKLSLASGDTVKVASRRGEIRTKVKVVDRTLPGTVFMSFHYSESPVNALTNPACCPTAKIPEYKVCAVKVEKVQ